MQWIGIFFGINQRNVRMMAAWVRVEHLVENGKKGWTWKEKHQNGAYQEYFSNEMLNIWGLEETKICVIKINTHSRTCTQTLCERSKIIGMVLYHRRASLIYEDHTENMVCVPFFFLRSPSPSKYSLIAFSLIFYWIINNPQVRDKP